MRQASQVLRGQPLLASAAIMGLPVGNSGSARVAFDWLVRVGGNARPDSGPAVNLSAGF